MLPVVSGPALSGDPLAQGNEGPKVDEGPTRANTVVAP